MEIEIYVQGTTEDAAAFANRLTAIVKQRGNEHLEVSFTTASDGRQTCNMVWNSHRVLQVNNWNQQS